VVVGALDVHRGRLVALPARVDGVRASRREPAAVRWVRRVRERSADAFRGVPSARQALQQRLRVGMGRVLEHVEHAPLLHHLPGVHDDDAVRDLRDDAEVVRDEEDAHPELVLEVPEQAEDLRLDGDVERGRRFVRDEEIGFARDRDRDHDALGLAAGELVGVVVEPLAGFRNADAVQEVHGDLAGLGLRDVLVQSHRLRDLPADGVDGIECTLRVLEHVPDAATPELPEALLGERQEVLALELDALGVDLPGRCRDESRDRFARDGLPAP